MANVPPQLGAAIEGLGAYRPARLVTNAKTCEHIDSTYEWIRPRSGITTRHFTTAEQTVVGMAAAAADRALAASSLAGKQVDCVLVATSTHFTQTPPAATQVAQLIGANGAPAFDISAGCAGFCHALAVAADMVRAGSAEKVMVIGAERMNDTTDPRDRITRFIFGDGAGAVVVGRSTETGIGPVVWGSDSSRVEVIRQEPDWLSLAEHPRGPRPWIRMDGSAVLRWAAFEMAKVALNAVSKAGLTLEQLGAFIPHHANDRITEALIRTLGLPAHVAVARDIVHTGNTSAASIPLAMETMLSSGAARPGDTALIMGFGAGLSYAAQTVTLPPVPRELSREEAPHPSGDTEVLRGIP